LGDRLSRRGDQSHRAIARLSGYVAGYFADAKENARFPSRAENAEGYFLSRAAMEWLAGHYLGDAKHGADWRVWPNQPVPAMRVLSVFGRLVS
jgi:hypothetical protein